MKAHGLFFMSFWSPLGAGLNFLASREATHKASPNTMADK